MGERGGHDHPVDPDRVDRARRLIPDEQRVEQAAELVTVLTEPTRARVLCALDGVEELCVGDLALALGASEDQVSYALRVLRRAGLVRSRREGRMVFYSLADRSAAATLRRSLDDLLALDEATGG